jgi:hypothetical protein
LTHGETQSTNAGFVPSSKYPSTGPHLGASDLSTLEQTKQRSAASEQVKHLYEQASQNDVYPFKKVP